MRLEHEDFILLASLLGCHTNGSEGTPMHRLADKLLNYADRTGNAHKVKPLPLEYSTEHPYGKRVMFTWETAAKDDVTLS